MIVSAVRFPLQTGGFFSAEDADSLPTADATKKREGAFCVWSYDDVQRLLGGLKVASADETSKATLADLVINYYNMKRDGNVDARMVR